MVPFFEDLQQGVRSSLRRPRELVLPVVTLAAVVALAVCLFSVVQGVLLRGLPFRGGDRFVLVATGPTEIDGTLVSDVEALRAQIARGSSALEALATSFAINSFVTASGRGTHGTTCAYVSADLFEFLGAEAARGRTLEPRDADPESPAVTVISHGLWQTYFGGAEDVVGQQLVVNRLSATVVGVMPPGFGFPYRQDLWVVDRPGSLFFDTRSTSVVARLAEGATVEQARAELSVLVESLEETDPRDRERGVWLKPYVEAVVDEGPRSALALLLSAVLGLALVACANVANLRLASAQGRRAELGIRSALGAGRSRLIGKLSAEAAVIVLFGGGLGLVAGALLTGETGRALLQGSLLRGFWMDVRLDATVVAFTMVLCGVCFVLAGLVPAWVATRSTIGVDLRASRASGNSLSAAFVAVQVGLCVALLVCAGAVGRTVTGMLTAELGFEENGLLTASVSLFQNGELSEEGRRLFHDELLRRLEARPEIAAAALASATPWGWAPTVEAKVGGSALTEDREVNVPLIPVREGYFDVLGMPVLLGRPIEARDFTGDVPVVVVSESWARRVFGTPDAALGAWFDWSERGRHQIVGVAADAGMVTQQADPKADELVYVSGRPTGDYRSLLFRARASEAAARQAIEEEAAAIDPLAAIYLPSSFAEDRAASTWAQRRLAQLLSLFSAAAVLLAAAGLYSVVDLSSRSRQREFGIRMAVGAKASQVYLLVLRSGASHLLLGLVLAFGLLLVGARKLELFLVGGTVWEPRLLILAVVLAVLVVVASTALPARRAARVDPARTLTAE